MTNETLITMNDIYKSFNGIPILKGVSLEVKKSEIHALLGENGAGKSTLMNILGGVFEPDSGSIFLEGKEVKISDSRTAQNEGVSFIHQELNVVGDLKVYENMFLGSELRNKIGFVKVEEMCRQASNILGKLGVNINPKEYVRNLEPSYKQLVEISKALLHKSKIIIMDEPTSALAEHEVNQLFEMMKNLVKSGVSIIYISHKLNEIKEVCDSYTVLRDGKLVGKGKVQNDGLDRITEMMVGKSISNERLILKKQFEATVLEVKGLSCEGYYRDINFSVKKGEIVGFTGLAGDGRSELFESIFGYRTKYEGEIYINDKRVNIDHPRKAIKAGIALIPKDRKENAIIKDLNVIKNMSLSSLGHFEHFGLINERMERNKFAHYKKMLNIKVNNPLATIDKLSGGNQQKVVIAKWLEVDADIIIFDNPTQGIDVGAKQEIYDHIIKLAKLGKAVIILSSEATEVLRICHQINIMFQGEIVARYDGENASESKIMGYATGAKKAGERIG